MLCVRSVILIYKLTIIEISGVYLIAATNTFIRFVHFKFGSDYHECIDAETESIQRALVDDDDKDTFVHMHSSKWFNLQALEDRRSALCHVLALIRWHDEQNALLLQGSHDPMGSE